MKKLIQAALGTVSGLAMILAMPLAARAASTVVVTPAHNDGWSTADTRPGGAVQFVYDPSSPAPSGALQLSTDDTNSAKAQYMHTANTALSDVKTLSYSTNQVAASSTTGDPSYQLVVCLGGLNNNTCTGGTTLVYEPYWNTGTQTVQANTWQNWTDVATGQFWSSKTYNDTTNTSCTVTAGSGGAPFYTLADLTTNCPKAQVVGFGVNIGTYNPSYVTEVDNVVFNDWTYDFQLTNVPNSKDQCKNNGFNAYTDENGNAFKNQGDCVSFTNGNNGNRHNNITATAAKNNGNSATYSQVKDNGERNNAKNIQATTQTQ